MEDKVVVQELLQFLRSHEVGALATIKEGKAHAASIYYYIDDDLRVYFLTRNETLKFSNMVKEGTVGFVVTDPVTLQTVQIEGTGREVDYTGEYAAVMKKYVDQLSKSGKAWENIPINHMLGTGYYAFAQITPSWIRWTDFKNWAHTVKFEQKF